MSRPSSLSEYLANKNTKQNLQTAKSKTSTSPSKKTLGYSRKP